MSFGGLETRQQMDTYFQSMRSISRGELLSQIYKKDGKAPTVKVEAQIAEALSMISSNYNYDPRSPVVIEILNIFDIKMSQIEGKSPQQRQTFVNNKIRNHIEENLKKIPNEAYNLDYEIERDNPQNSEFDWVGIKSNFPNLRGIFQEILLEKVRQFDEELSRTADKISLKGFDQQTQSITSRTFLKSNMSTRPFTISTSSCELKSNVSQFIKKSHKEMQAKGFTNVLIRDHSQFSLQKWTSHQQKQFQRKKNQFRVNFKKNGQQTPIIFQFVKKYTNTVKARDNIYHKWENREKNGISPEELKYLCSTSLFLNKTLNQSEKKRLNRNIKSLGKDLISKLEFNIAEKIIQTYRQFMKKVLDLRAHYYEELTEKRKLQYQVHKQKKVQTQKGITLQRDFLKFKQVFKNICNSQKMKVILNPRVYRWVKKFMQNLKMKYEAKTGKKLYSYQQNKVFSKLSSIQQNSAQLLKAKLKYPSARVIKREELGTMKQLMKKYVPSDRFFYEKSFQSRIKSLNSKKLKSEQSFRKQISGGPKKKMGDKIIVNLVKKQIILSSSKCLQAIIKIQAKWRAIMGRRNYLEILQIQRQEEEQEFKQKLKSLNAIYPFGKKINIKLIKNRLQRVSMRTFNILKPYFRVAKKPINNYTSFCNTNLSLAELKIKQAKNSSRRLAQFGKMIEENQTGKMMRSGFVVNAKQLNDPVFKEGASAMWWAVKNSNVELAKKFLEGGGNPNGKNYENSTCLHEAMQNGDIQIIFMLLDYGADLNAKNNKKATPLYFATPKMLKLLGLQQGIVSNEGTLKDNNSTFFNPPAIQPLYPEHFY